MSLVRELRVVCWSSECQAKMVLAKSKNTVGLGNSLMNDRFGRGKGADRKKVSAGIHRKDQSGQTVRHVSLHLAKNLIKA